MAENQTGAFTFGPYPTSPLDLANAYNTLAANGTRCDPSPVAEILDRDGQPLDQRRRRTRSFSRRSSCPPEAISPGVASVLNQILGRRRRPGRSGRDRHPGRGPRPPDRRQDRDLAGDYSVAFVGDMPQYTASVMVLNPKRNQDVGGFGGGKGATIWHDAMAPILDWAADGAVPARRPPGQEGNTKRVPECGGVNDCEQTLQAAGFRTIIVEVDSDREAGFVVGTSPAAGSACGTRPGDRDPGQQRLGLRGARPRAGAQFRAPAQPEPGRERWPRQRRRRRRRRRWGRNGPGGGGDGGG